ncbi:bifunctional lysylphosphatidylglycerol flippase/synthetase MprF [Arthrobacter liuii]|uniref:bifunctional lysylphosphatidylglycerol flippase/synthetase MprF n=1 Tax=Arthrobacter liuii TaxID=1476996 RepID=UPI001E5AD790|nr:DUF2156 domain-containing protein [Arthrobacter liuii]
MADLLADLPDRFLPLGYTVDVPPAFFPQSSPSVLLYEGVGILFWAVTGVLILKTFLRPTTSRSRNDRARALEILKNGDSNSISWMTTWAGNTYWFSTSGKTFIAYRVNSGVALTLGAPVGQPAGLSETLEEFSRYCKAKGWTPCIYAAPASARDAASELGWEATQIAQETVLPLESLSFKGKKFQDIRTAMNKAEKAGIRAQWVRYPTAARHLKNQIVAISEEWVADRKMPEMGFTLGGLDELNDPEVRCLLALDNQNHVHAVTSWLPVYHHGRIVGWTLDFMRRNETGFRPAIEFLIASAATTLLKDGYEFISLSAAPLAHVPQGKNSQTPPADLPEASGLDRLLDNIGSALEPVYGFRSLLAFKAKFHPHYHPLFMIYPDSASLPAIGNALSRAYLPSLSVREVLRLLHQILRRGSTTGGRAKTQKSSSLISAKPEPQESHEQLSGDAKHGGTTASAGSIKDQT